MMGETDYMLLLGEALSPPQLRIFGGSALLFNALEKVVARQRLLKKSAEGSWIPLTEAEMNDLGVTACGFVHAVVSSAVALSIFVQRDPAIYTNIYGRSPVSQALFAFSAGYFAWDLKATLLNYEQHGPAFLFHALACGLLYTFGQYPFLNYYGAMFLLFELSTPIMHVRVYMLKTGRQNHPWFESIQTAFGVTFLLCRIVYGYPLSAMFQADMIALLRAGQAHNTGIVLFNMAANVALCWLNGMWLWMMLKRKLKSAKKN